MTRINEISFNASLLRELRNIEFVNRTLLLQLKDAGRAAMEDFLARDRDKLGRRSSVDLRAIFTSAGSGV